jgi:hypothetical protein
MLGLLVFALLATVAVVLGFLIVALLRLYAIAERVQDVLDRLAPPANRKPSTPGSSESEPGT